MGVTAPPSARPHVPEGVTWFILGQDARSPWPLLLPCNMSEGGRGLLVSRLSYPAVMMMSPASGNPKVALQSRTTFTAVGVGGVCLHLLQVICPLLVIPAPPRSSPPSTSELSFVLGETPPGFWPPVCIPACVWLLTVMSLTLEQENVCCQGNG